jgi:hypothetical protein
MGQRYLGRGQVPVVDFATRPGDEGAYGFAVNRHVARIPEG